jgi:hypothetical protein
MKKHLFVSILLAITYLPIHASIIYRNWTDREGRTIEARLIQYQNGQVTIERV